MKHPLLFLLFTAQLSGALLAQRRTPQEQNPPPQQELATVLTYLQQQGDPNAKQEPGTKKDGKTEEQKFQEAAAGMFAGFITVLSGAATGSPLQVAGGIFSMFSAAFLATTRSPLRDQELEEIDGLHERRTNKRRRLEQELLSRYQTAFKTRRR